MTEDNVANRTPEEPSRLWTVMVYFAVDDPGQPGMDILQKLKQVGSTDRVALLAHGDPEGMDLPKSYYLQKGTKLNEDIRFRYTSPPRDPAAFTEFVQWGLTDYAAKYYILIIWGHGDGWQSRDVALHVPSTGTGFVETGAANAPAAGRIDTPPDLLDCQKLKDNLQAVLSDPEVIQKNRKGKKIDILGMDSCLMAMAEVAYQLKDGVRYMIACEEVEPISSWPYDYIFKDLTEYSLNPEQLAQLIVRKYIISYREAQSYVTQSVLDLEMAGLFCEDVRRLTDALIRVSGFDKLERALMSSRALVQRYFIEEYVDLYDFCQLLIEECDYFLGEHGGDAKQAYGGEGGRYSEHELAQEIKRTCRAVMDAIRGTNGTYTTFNARALAPIHGLYGFPLRRSYGVSIYFPCRDRSDAYKNLDFAVPSGWGKFLDGYAPKRTQKNGSGQNAAKGDRVDAIEAAAIREAEKPVKVEDGDKIMCFDCGTKAGGPNLEDPMIFPYDPIRRRRPDCWCKEQ